jgi:hypothetical protein
MKVFELLQEQFHDDGPEIPEETKQVISGRIEKYRERIKQFETKGLIKRFGVVDTVRDEDILPGEKYVLTVQSPKVREHITDTFKKYIKVKHDFHSLSFSNPTNQFTHIQDRIQSMRMVGNDMGSESWELQRALRDLVKSKNVIPKALVPLKKRATMIDVGQLDTASYFIPPGPNQSKVAKYIAWWKDESKKLDDKLNNLRKERETWRGKSERYKAGIIKDGDKETSKEAALTSVKLAYQYAMIHGRFPEGEDLLASDPKYGLAYALNILKGRFPKLERSIEFDPRYAVKYATGIGMRFLLAEPNIKAYGISSTDENNVFVVALKQYEKYFGIKL